MPYEITYLNQGIFTFIVLLTRGVRSAEHLCTHHIVSPFFFTNYFLPFVIYLVLMKKPNNKEQITNKQNLFQLVEKFVKTQNLFFVKTCDEQLIMVYKNCSLYLRFPVGCQQ